MLLNRVCQDILLIIYSFYLKEVEDLNTILFILDIVAFAIMLVIDIGIEIMKRNDKVTYIYHQSCMVIIQILLAESQIKMNNENLYLYLSVGILLQNTLLAIYLSIQNYNLKVYFFLGISYVYLYVRAIIVQHYLNYILLIILALILSLCLWSTITIIMAIQKLKTQQVNSNQSNLKQNKNQNQSLYEEIQSPQRDQIDQKQIIRDINSQENQDNKLIVDQVVSNHDFAQVVESQRNFELIQNPQSSFNSIKFMEKNKCESTSKTFSLFNFIPDGIAFISSINLTLQFTNDSFKQLLNTQVYGGYLESLKALKNIKVVELQKFEEKSSNLEESLASSTIYQDFSPFLSAFAKNSKNQSDPLFKTSSLKQEKLNKSLEQNEFMKASVDHISRQSNNILLEQLFKIQQFQNNGKFKKHLLNQPLKSQLIAVYLAYSYSSLQPVQLPYKGDKKLIEISLFCVLLDDEITIILQARDVSYKDYIKKQKELSKEKSNIISFVSHEYRSTLNSIINLLSAVIEDQSDQYLNLKYNQIAYNNAQFLLNLSNDLLDLAQIKVGKFSIIPKRFDLNELLRECIAMFQLQANAKNIILQDDFDILCQTIYSDPNRIKQIVINLLANAFKFTSQGSITIRSSVQEDKLIKVEVEDTGVGIKTEDQSKLFKAFGKINNEENKKLNSQGVGLGLLISDKIAKNLNKDQNIGLQFSSKFLKGTKFWFLIKSQSQLKNTQVVSVIQEEDEDSLKCEDEYFKADYRNYNPPFIRTFLSNKSSTNQGKQNQISQEIECSCPKILVVDDTPFNITTFKVIINKMYNKS